MTIDQLIEQTRQAIREKLASRATHTDTIENVRSTCLGENRDPTDAEASHVQTATEARATIDAEIEQLQARETEQLEEKRRDEAADRLSREIGPGSGRPAYDRVARTGNEEHTYRPDNGSSFFRDLYLSREGHNEEARARLTRHMEEVRRDAESGGEQLRAIGTSNVGGLVVPQYLVDEFAPILRNGRPFLNAIRTLPLPAEGMSLIVPRGNTGAAAAAQATQNTQVQNTDLDFDSDLTVPVRTYAGEQDVARQILERGTDGMDQLIYADLVDDYGTKLDAAALNGDGTSGTHKGVLNAAGTNAITYTDTTPTVAEAWPKLANAKGQVGAKRKRAANLWVMTTTRWAWFVSALDSQNRPLLIDDPSAAVNAIGTSAAENFGEGQLVGMLQGTPVLTDDNLPTDLGSGTNQDDIIALRRQDAILWEEGDGMPRELRFDQTKGNTLTVTMVVYGYSAFTAERYPEAKSIISGTGLVAPTF